MVSLLRFPDIKPAVSIHDDVFVKIRNGPDFIVPDIEVKLLHRSFVQGSHHLQPGGFTDSPVFPYLNSKIQPEPFPVFHDGRSARPRVPLPDTTVQQGG